ncbi:cysteine proteinase, partial [Stipitochalara longipes BDJ]
MSRTRSRRSKSPEEFPMLKPLGLMAMTTKADGNCMFNSFSDQLYGDQSHAREIRAKIIEHMRDHADEYKPFINVEAGGGFRRNPKRKNVGASSTHFENSLPTQEQIDAAWERHLDNMSKNGVYGDNMEIRAFTKAFGVDVKIYNRDNSYYIKAEDQGTRPVVHVARHNWEHYSSIRNVHGPHIGLPDIKVTPQDEAVAAKAAAGQGPYIAEWMVNAVTTSLPFLAANDTTIRKALYDNNGNIDAAVSALMDEPSSTPSTPGSFRSVASSQSGASSIERDAESDDEDEIWGPNKRQNRKVKAIKRATKSKTSTPEIMIKGKDASLPDMKAMEILFI